MSDPHTIEDTEWLWKNNLIHHPDSSECGCYWCLKDHEENSGAFEN